jgi:hypothetical protein
MEKHARIAKQVQQVRQQKQRLQDFYRENNLVRV